MIGDDRLNSTVVDPTQVHLKVAILGGRQNAQLMTSRYPKSLLILFSFYSVCFLGACFNHSRDIVSGGFLPYRHSAIVFNVFWTSLAFVDPLVPILFVLHRARYAIVLAVAIMIADVAMNSFYAFYYLDGYFVGNIDLLAQTAFLAFLLVSVPIAWTLVPEHQRDRTTR